MLRLNVVCTERDQRFMVLGREEETLDSFRHQTQTIFQELYPNEAPLNIVGFQNEFHFDIPLQYKIGDALIDTGLVFAIEADSNNERCILNTDSGVSFSNQNVNREETMEIKSELSSPEKRKSENSGKKLKSHKKRKSRNETNESQSLVSSTGSPKAEGSPLFPQRVESGDEDNEVDIESLHEEKARSPEKDKIEKHKQTIDINFLTSTPFPQTSNSASSKRDKKLTKKKKKKRNTTHIDCGDQKF